MGKQYITDCAVIDISSRVVEFSPVSRSWRPACWTIYHGETTYVAITRSRAAYLLRAWRSRSVIISS